MRQRGRCLFIAMVVAGWGCTSPGVAMEYFGSGCVGIYRYLDSDGCLVTEDCDGVVLGRFCEPVDSAANFDLGLRDSGTESDRDAVEALDGAVDSDSDVLDADGE